MSVVVRLKVPQQCTAALRFWFSLEEAKAKAADPPVKPDAQLVAQAKKLAQSGDPAAVVDFLAPRHAVVFAHAPKPKDVQSFFSLLSSLMQASGQASKRAQALLDGIAESTDEAQASTRLRVMGTFYNSFEPSDAMRATVFEHMVSYAVTTNQLSVLASMLERLPQLCEAWGAGADVRRRIAKRVADAHQAAGDAKAALEWRRRVVRLAGSEAAAEAADDAADLVLAALRDPSQYRFDDLLALPAVAGLAKSRAPVHALLHAFVHEGPAQLEAWLASNDAAALSLDADELRHKMRLLAVADAAAAAVAASGPGAPTVLPFADVASAASVGADDVEPLVADAVAAGLVGAKLNQVDQTMRVTSHTHRAFGRPQWEHVAQGLDNWLHRLDAAAEAASDKGAQAALQQLVV